MAKPKFPKKLFVAVRGERGEQWFSATSAIDPECDGEQTAVYELKEVKTARIRETLE